MRCRSAVQSVHFLLNISRKCIVIGTFLQGKISRHLCTDFTAGTYVQNVGEEEILQDTKNDKYDLNFCNLLTRKGG